MKRNLYIKLITALCLTVSLAGCIKEDGKDCYEVFLAFECINPDYNFPEIVKELELLFYDPAGQLIYDLPYTSSQLAANSWKVNLTNDIPQPGLYTVVALVNYHTGPPLSLSAKTEKEKFLAEINYNNQRWVDYTVTDSYHGICELELKKNNDRTVQYTVPLSKHTNTIQLTVEFTNREAAGNLTRYSSYLIGENARYKWNYTIPPHTPVYYKPYSTTWQSGGTTLVDQHKTMRLHADGNLKLHLEFESNGTLHTQILDIPSILAKVEKNGVYLYDTNEKLEMHDYFEIKIQIGEGYVIATLTVNEWFLVIAGEDM